MGELGINAWGLAVQLVAFIAFILLFWKYALGPITNMLDERSRRISESMAAAEAMKAEMARASVRNEEILVEARQQAQQIISQARDVSEATIARAQKEAGEQAEEYLSRAQATLRQETEQARLQLRQELADLAVMAAGRIVRKELDPAAQSRLIEETLAEATVPTGRPKGVGKSARLPTNRCPKGKDTRGQQRGKTVRTSDLQSWSGAGDARHLGRGSGDALPRRRRRPDRDLSDQPERRRGAPDRGAGNLAQPQCADRSA